MWRRCSSAGPRRSTRWRRALRWPTTGTLIRSTWATLPPARPTAAPVFGHRSCSSCLRCVEATLTLPWPYRIWAWEYACSFMRKWACMRLRTCVTVWVCRREVSVRSWSIAFITTINTTTTTTYYCYYYYLLHLLLPTINTTTTTTTTIYYYYHYSYYYYHHHYYHHTTSTTTTTTTTTTIYNCQPLILLPPLLLPLLLLSLLFTTTTYHYYYYHHQYNYFYYIHNNCTLSFRFYRGRNHVSRAGGRGEHSPPGPNGEFDISNKGRIGASEV